MPASMRKPFPCCASRNQHGDMPPKHRCRHRGARDSGRRFDIVTTDKFYSFKRPSEHDPDESSFGTETVCSYTYKIQTLLRTVTCATCLLFPRCIVVNLFVEQRLMFVMGVVDT